MSDFSSNYYVSSGICCPIGTYAKNGLCEPITIADCKRGELDAAGTLICTMCTNMSQEPDQTLTACTNKQDTTLYYTG